MKFVDVPGTDVLMCIHETRNKDYQAYADEVPGAMGIWVDGVARGMDPMVENRANHPVIRVNWEGSSAFCAWLSKKENRVYRLPTDREWSYAVGLGAEEKWTTETTPAAIAKNTTVFPWGTAWPPPPGTGNYSDETRRRRFPTTGEYVTGGYDDGFFSTAPVMSFGPNKLGIYDLSGNVREWVEDWFDDTHKGHAWSEARLLGRVGEGESAHRPTATASMRRRILQRFGFRCVLERKRPAIAPVFVPPPPAAPPVYRHANPLPLAPFPQPLPPEEVARRSVTNSLGHEVHPHARNRRPLLHPRDAAAKITRPSTTKCPSPARVRMEDAQRDGIVHRHGGRR